MVLMLRMALEVSCPPRISPLSLFYPLRFVLCVAPGGTCVSAMCRGRHRVENRVGEVQARGGAGRGGAGRLRTSLVVSVPGNVLCVLCLSV